MAKRRNLRRAIAATLVAAGIASLVACTSHHSAVPPTTSPTTTVAPTSPSPRPTPTPTPLDADSAAVLAAYKGYWAAKVAAWSDPMKEPGPELATYAVDTAYSDAVSSLFDFRKQGIAVVGQPVLNPAITNVNPTGTRSATIADCVDVSDWRPVFVKTGQSALAPGQSPRVLTNSTAIVYAGRWVIRTSVVDRDAAC
jgi:hypothetical protein